MNKPPSSPTLNPSTRQGQNVLALGEPVGLAGTLLGLIEHPIAIARLRALIIELATSGRLRQRKTGPFRQSTIGPASEQLPEGWVRLPLSELAVDFQNGIAKRSGDRGTPIPVLRLADITRLKLKETELREIILTPEEQTKYQVDRGDFLVIRVNGSGELVGRFIPCTVQRQWAYSDHLIRVRPRADLVDQRYLCLFANSETARRHLVDKTVTTAGQKTINQGGLGSLPVMVPPIEEQKRIVAKVDQLMALCDDLEAKQTKKRDLATQSTYSAVTALASAERGAELSLAWQRVASSFQTFVSKSDDVRNLRGAIAELATRGLLTAQSEKERPAAELTAKLDAASVGDTDTLPLLPSNWLWARLADLLAFGPKNGYSPKAVEYPTDVKALTLSATTSGRFAPQYFKYIDEKIPKDSDLWLRDGDVLIQRGNTLDYVGIAAVYRGRDAEFIYPDLMIKIRAADFVDVDFLHLALNARPTRDYFKAHASGTSGTMPKINQSVLLETPIPVPPLAEQNRIVAKVDHLISLLDDLESKLRKQEETATRLAESLAAAVAR